jgi:hypothetical protein
MRAPSKADPGIESTAPLILTENKGLFGFVSQNWFIEP